MDTSKQDDRPTYEVTFERAALKGIRNADPKAKTAVMDAADALGSDPRPEGYSALQGKLKGYFRIRITGLPGGEYRVLYEIDDKARKVNVVNMGTREDIY